MVALQRDFEDSVRAAIDAGADAIVSGAGLPLSLPAVQPAGETALVPIVSSPRALDIICRRWERQRYRPDAVVLEGPLAGGHLGFRADQVDLDENTLERLLPLVKEVALAHGDFPVIVAGGIYTHEDIRRFSASAPTACRWGRASSPPRRAAPPPRTRQPSCAPARRTCWWPTCPARPAACPSACCASPRCTRRPSSAGVRPAAPKATSFSRTRRAGSRSCAAKEDNERCFCICEGLFSAAGYNADKEEPLYTAGTTAARVDRILSVADLMAELAGARLSAPAVA